MTPLHVTANLELNPWVDLAAGGQNPDHGILERIGLLPAGTINGKASVGMVARTDTGQPIVIQTTWALLLSAVHALSHSPVAQMEDL